MLSITPVTPAKIMTPEEVEEWDKTHTINETPELKAAKLEWFRHLLSLMHKEKIGGEKNDTTRSFVPNTPTNGILGS